MGIKANKTLLHLKLRHNPSMGDEFAKAIAGAVKANLTLVTLSLWETGLGDDGGTIVAQAFKENRAIRDLDLRYNEMGDKAGAALIDMLKTNTCLQKITLYRNPFSSVVKQSLKLDARVVLD